MVLPPAKYDAITRLLTLLTQSFVLKHTHLTGSRAPDDQVNGWHAHTPHAPDDQVNGWHAHPHARVHMLLMTR